MAQHAGRFPRDFEDVLALPGIGRYTAGAICSIAFNQPKPILDGNVMRVLTRWHGIAGDPRERNVNARLWQLAEELVQQAAQARHSRITHHASRVLRSAQPIADGTRRARLHPTTTPVRRLSDREPLRRLSGRPSR